MLRIFPPLRIHAWGGLGSQLFAVALASDITRRFPKRKLVIILHSSGVTKRKPEVCELFPEFKYIEIDDFLDRKSHDSKLKKRSLRRFVLHLLRAGALSSGILAEENVSHSRLVHGWTLSIRGHYSYRQIGNEFLSEIERRLTQLSKLNASDYKATTVIHYRLGDLLELTNKNSIPAERILNVICQMTEIESVTVLSDSPQRALHLLENVSCDHQFQAQELTTVQTIWAASQAKVFLGTSSKISYWVVLLRNYRDESLPNFMPNEDKKTLKVIKSNCVNVKFY